MTDLLDTARLDAVCAAALATHHCPSVSVAVAAEGEVVHAGAWGLADSASGRAAEPGTAYGVGSVTKPMTATAVCRAADAGLLDLDAPVPAAALPYFGPHRRPTARELLRHRGGLGAFYAWDYGDGAAPVDPDRYAVRHRAPGSGFEYANLGYRVLGRLLEDVTGRPLGHVLRDEVFGPLGLDSCHLGPVHPGPGPAAVRYTADGRPYPAYDCGHPGATLGWATASDLALFAQRAPSLLTPATTAAVRDALPLNEHLGYGLGWCVAGGGRDGRPLVLSHSGGGGGTGAMVVAVPEQRLSVAVLTNSTNKAARDAVLGALLGMLVPGFQLEWIIVPHDDPERPLELPPGRWTGRIPAPERELAVELRIREAGRIDLRVDGERAEGTASASRDWDLRAALPLPLPTADARVNSPLLSLGLRRSTTPDGAELTGVATAYKAGEAGGFLGNYLSHRVALRPS
ncbi:CubicO group peptidase, beta-lactamase class C family [Streptomyces sp. DvalAA-14]|uniref:serine hydrolase domain-containing protein n=1 Tax=unclassified Streptomyces TaxID=2593676 RepID=UPI00081AF654|nr:serine hydrolase domain-containing protein [Streptomyces sp. DvalAA-14]SCD79770.1 CubicO group peptidase, beta-lactamase class C family [Streptomyces sp. DvalAA-14]